MTSDTMHFFYKANNSRSFTHYQPTQDEQAEDHSQAAYCVYDVRRYLSKCKKNHGSLAASSYFHFGVRAFGLSSRGTTSIHKKQAIMCGVLFSLGARDCWFLSDLYNINSPASSPICEVFYFKSIDFSCFYLWKQTSLFLYDYVAATDTYYNNPGLLFLTGPLVRSHQPASVWQRCVLLRPCWTHKWMPPNTTQNGIHVTKHRLSVSVERVSRRPSSYRAH